MKNTVVFNDDYFKKTIYEYQDWEFAFCRETAQNCCDAKATEIRYTITETEDEVTIICEDNGSGMSEDVLLTKFLVMGASFKDSEDAVGGFGYAKGIILFCHKSYTIHTNDLLLTGSYGRYNDPEKTEKRKGTKLTIVMDRDMSSAYKMKTKLEKWVRYSSLPKTKVFLNDQELEQSGKKFDYKKQTSIGDLMINEVKEYSYQSILWVRMRGMAMFEKTVYSDEMHFNGFIDLDSNSSIECLTANRDGLKSHYEHGLSELIKYLSSELSALECSKMDGFEINEIDEEFSELDEGVFAETSLVPQEKKASENYRKERIMNNASNILSIEDADELLEKAKKLNAEMIPKINKIINKIDKKSYGTSFLVKIDNLENKTNREILKEYNASVRILNQNRIKKQASVWNSLINAMLQSCYDHCIGGLSFDGKTWIYEGRTIHCGAILSENSKTFGMCSQNQEKIHVLFNPISCKNKNLDTYGLMLIAVHEVAHIFEMNHGEFHSYLMFEIQNAFHKSGYKLKQMK